MKSMNLEKITATMDQFEKSFEGIDLVTSTMEGAMGDAMATSAPSGQVDALIQQVLYCSYILPELLYHIQVADENNLQIQDEMATAPIGNSRYSNSLVYCNLNYSFSV